MKQSLCQTKQSPFEKKCSLALGYTTDFILNGEVAKVAPAVQFELQARNDI